MLMCCTNVMLWAIYSWWCYDRDFFVVVWKFYNKTQLNTAHWSYLFMHALGGGTKFSLLHDFSLTSSTTLLRITNSCFSHNLKKLDSRFQFCKLKHTQSSPKSFLAWHMYDPPSPNIAFRISSWQSPLFLIWRYLGLSSGIITLL